MSDELKPCPFCGSPAQFRRIPKTIDGIPHVECSDISCRVLFCGITGEDAMKKWNTRVEDAKLAKAREMFGLLEDQIRRIDNADLRTVRKNAAENVGRYLGTIRAILGDNKP